MSGWFSRQTNEQQPTSGGKVEMEAAQTGLLIFLWEGGIYEDGSQV